MVTSMGIKFPKTMANKLRCPPGGRIMNNPIWPPPEHENLTYQLHLWVESSVIPLFHVFSYEESIFVVTFELIVIFCKKINILWTIWWTQSIKFIINTTTICKLFLIQSFTFFGMIRHTHIHKHTHTYIYVHFKNLNSHHLLITKSSASTHTLISCYFVLI